MMTKEDRLANRDYAAVVNELLSEGMIDILPKDILQRYLKSAVDQDGRHIPSGWACEIEEHLLYVRNLVEVHYRHNIVAVNVKFYKRRSKKPPASLEEAHEFVRFSINLRPAGLHMVKDAENDWLWKAWVINKKDRTTGAAIRIVNHVDDQVLNGQLSEESAIEMMRRQNSKLYSQNQSLMNVLAGSLTGPEQMRLGLQKSPKPREREEEQEE